MRLARHYWDSFTICCIRPFQYSSSFTVHGFYCCDGFCCCVFVWWVCSALSVRSKYGRLLACLDRDLSYDHDVCGIGMPLGATMRGKHDTSDQHQQHHSVHHHGQVRISQGSQAHPRRARKVKPLANISVVRTLRVSFLCSSPPVPSVHSNIGAGMDNGVYAK